MITGIGNDIIEVSRIKKAIEKSENFKKRVFTENEINYIERKRDKYPSYAGRFAAKEAFSKAIGTGVRGFNLTDIEIINDESGRPIFFLKGQLHEKYGSSKFHLSISHTREYAVATVVVEKP